MNGQDDDHEAALPTEYSRKERERDDRKTPVLAQTQSSAFPRVSSVFSGAAARATSTSPAKPFRLAFDCLHVRVHVLHVARRVLLSPFPSRRAHKRQPPAHEAGARALSVSRVSVAIVHVVVLYSREHHTGKRQARRGNV